MAGLRADLHTKLLTITPTVYFQPPSTVKMDFPCIVYQRSDDKTEYADNSPYHRMKKYQVTVIDEDPDSDIPDTVAALSLCSFDRFFATDGLNHDVFSLFF